MKKQTETTTDKARQFARNEIDRTISERKAKHDKTTATPLEILVRNHTVNNTFGRAVRAEHAALCAVAELVENAHDMDTPEMQEALRDLARVRKAVQS